jgi:hypothetical protein
VRSRSDGGDQTGRGGWLRAGPLLFAAVKSPELGRVHATAVPGSPELVREGEDDSANSMAGLWPRDQGQRGGNGGEEFRPPGGAISHDRARASSSRGGGALWAKARALDGVELVGHRAGAASKRGRTLVRPNWLKAGANRVKQARGWVSHLRAELGVAWRGLRRAR